MIPRMSAAVDVLQQEWLVSKVQCNTFRGEQVHDLVNVGGQFSHTIVHAESSNCTISIHFQAMAAQCKQLPPMP